MMSRPIFTALVLLGFLHFRSIVDASGEWGYENINGPLHWPTMFPENCSGLSQSPIDLVTGPAQFDSQLSSLNLASYDNVMNPAITTATFINTGHSVSVQFAYGDTNVYSISGGGLPTSYTLRQLHFHWGIDDTVGSEHRLNGVQYPMEVHFVHYSAANDVAVIGFFFQISTQYNTAYDLLIANMQNVLNRDANVTLPYFNSISSLLPASRGSALRYSGSLTTPNCTEGVTWTFFTQPIPIASNQLAEFRKVYHNLPGDPLGDVTLVNNFRPPQPLNGRIVLMSTASSVVPRFVIMQSSLFVLLAVLK